MKYDVALYGNWTIDEIHGKKSRMKFGGIANIKDHLHRLWPECKIVCVPAKISYYRIEDGKAEELYAIEKKVVPVKARWSHWSYVDESYRRHWCESFANQSRHVIVTPAHSLQHFPWGSMIHTGYTMHPKTTHKVYRNLDTLGAGDMLVAEIIYRMLHNKQKLEDCIGACHRSVVKYLRAR